MHTCKLSRFHGLQSFERRSRVSRTSWWSRRHKRSIKSDNSLAQRQTQKASKEMLTSLGNSALSKRLAWWSMLSEAKRGNSR